jgi:hypothetical protein
MFSQRWLWRFLPIIHSSMALQPFVGPWPLLLFRNVSYTDGRTPLTVDQLVTRPLPAPTTTQTQNKHIHILTTMVWVGSELTIPAFVQAKTVHALDQWFSAFVRPRPGKYWCQGPAVEKHCLDRAATVIRRFMPPGIKYRGKSVESLPMFWKNMSPLSAGSNNKSSQTPKWKQVASMYGFIIRPWKWERHVSSKSRLTFYGLHGVISWKIAENPV